MTNTMETLWNGELAFCDGFSVGTRLLAEGLYGG